MGKLIMITQDAYDRLVRLRHKYKTKSFTDMINRMAADYDTRDLLAAEISAAFKELQVKVSQSMLDGRCGSLIERLRVMMVRIAKIDPNKRGDIFIEAEKIVDNAMKTIVSMCELQTADKEKNETVNRSVNALEGEHAKV